MKIKAFVLSLGLQLLALIGFGQTKIIYYKDLSVGTDQMAQALAGLGVGYTVYTATSPGDFQTRISVPGDYDLGIYFNQDGNADVNAITALADFMDAGGRAIYADWTEDNTLANRFGASFTFANNDPTVTITDACLATDIGTNPMTLTNPGWGIFSTGMAPLMPMPSSTTLATFGDGNAAVVKNGNGRALVIGFLNDTPPAMDGVQFFKNTITCTGCTPMYTTGPTVGAVTAVCAGQGTTLSFDATECLKTGNTFTAYLSDASGNFPGGGTSLGTVSPGVSNPITIPAGTPTGAGYKIRIVSTNAPAMTSADSNPFSVTGLASNFNTNPTVSQTPACAGANVKVTFTVQNNPCAFPTGTVFTAQLSDASGSFAAPVTLGTVSPGINNATIPQTTPTGSGYRVRIAATAGGSSAYSNVSAAFTVNQPSFAAAPTVSLDNKCAGEAVRLSFAIKCNFFAGNTFTAYLSDASGAFPGGGTSLGTVTPGAMNNVVIPVGTPAGTGYKIRVVSSNPVVTSAASANFKVKACAVTREAAPEDLGMQVRVSPNPSPEGRLRIHVSGVEGQALKVALFNGTGQPVREQSLERAGEEEVLDWDISRQPQGLYLLRVSGAKEAKTLKVLH